MSHSVQASGEPWRGNGNPAGNNLEARLYRDRLRALIGMDNLDDYARTAYVRQGGLPETSLSEDLLRAAGGGDIDVDAARKSIRERFRELTLAPIDEGDRSAFNPRQQLVLYVPERKMA